VGYPNLWSDTV